MIWFSVVETTLVGSSTLVPCGLQWIEGLKYAAILPVSFKVSREKGKERKKVEFWYEFMVFENFF